MVHRTAYCILSCACFNFRYSQKHGQVRRATGLWRPPARARRVSVIACSILLLSVWLLGFSALSIIQLTTASTQYTTLISSIGYRCFVCCKCAILSCYNSYSCSFSFYWICVTVSAALLTLYMLHTDHYVNVTRLLYLLFNSLYTLYRCPYTVSGEHEPNVILKDNDIKYKIRCVFCNHYLSAVYGFVTTLYSVQLVCTLLSVFFCCILMCSVWVRLRA